MHYANQAIYFHNRSLVYLSPIAITARLDQKPWAQAAPHWERWWGLSTLLFVCTLRASIHTEACPPSQLHGFDSMEWEGPSLPRVWYNESELTTHDLRLSQIGYLKQLEPETVQQTALIHLYTRSGSLFSGLIWWVVVLGKGVGVGGGGQCVLTCDRGRSGDGGPHPTPATPRDRGVQLCEHPFKRWALEIEASFEHK